MKLTYYKDQPNFGDSLNGIMWDALIEPGFFDNDDSTLFLGIGSIIWDLYKSTSKKLIVGSGYGGYTDPPNVHDGTWECCFVRGPRTASILKLDHKLAIADAAILTHFLKLPSQEKKYKTSFMPHFQSIEKGNWELVCLKAGINFIDPRNDPLSILIEIQQTDKLLTEAMHGAILADTLRVPWVACQPIGEQHHEKWYDFGDSLKTSIEFQDLEPSSFIEYWIKTKKGYGSGWKANIAKKVLFPLNKVCINRAVDRLLAIEKSYLGQLSHEDVFLRQANRALESLSSIPGIKLKI